MPHTLLVDTLVVLSSFGLLDFLEGAEHWGVHFEISYFKLMDSVGHLLEAGFTLFSSTKLLPLVEKRVSWTPVLTRLEVKVWERSLQITLENLLNLLAEVKPGDVVLLVFIHHKTIIHHDLLGVKLVID